MPVDDLPTTATFFQYRRPQSAAVKMFSFRVAGNCIFERRPGDFAVNFYFLVRGSVSYILHFLHLRRKMIVAIIRPAVIGVSVFKNRYGFIVSPDFIERRQIVLRESRRVFRQNLAD